MIPVVHWREKIVNQTSFEPWWAALTVWVIVNSVNLLQGAGFLSRILTGSRAINQILGYVIVALAVPAAAALIAFLRAGAGWLYWLGPAVYMAFIVVHILVEYVWRTIKIGHLAIDRFSPGA